MNSPCHLCSLRKQEASLILPPSGIILRKTIMYQAENKRIARVAQW